MNTKLLEEKAEKLQSLASIKFKIEQIEEQIERIKGVESFSIKYDFEKAENGNGQPYSGCRNHLEIQFQNIPESKSLINEPVLPEFLSLIKEKHIENLNALKELAIKEFEEFCE